MAECNPRPANVGIIAMEAYFPHTYISQEDLEKHAGVSAGRFTIGLGQEGLGFVSDREDIYSVSLTVVANLMKKYKLSYGSIGRLEVATETILDHSKSVKTFLMTLFEASGNSDVEGVDTMNACYAGTNALFNSIAWVESSDWDGRYAIVVTADIAEYAKGPARPTGGCGAVAMLIGPDAPLVLENGNRSSHMEHAYDFYKPNLSSPYPVVDGKFSNECYLRSVDTCYARYVAKTERRQGLVAPVDLSCMDYVAFHAPYNKLVQKSFARLVYNDFLREAGDPKWEPVEGHRALTREQSYTSGTLHKDFLKFAKAAYQTKVGPTTLFPRAVGNMYTAALYGGIASLISEKGRDLAGKRVLCFSYGSGLASTMFSISVRGDARSRAQLQKIQGVLALRQRLSGRRKATPEEFSVCMDTREGLHKNHEGFAPKGSVDDIAPGSFFLTRKDDRGRRFYDRKLNNIARL